MVEMKKEEKGIAVTESNPFIRDAKRREEIFELLAYESSVVEGARRIPKPSLLRGSSRSKASANKRVKGS